MSPWFILAIVVAAGAACGESYYKGHTNGATAQKVEDQAGIDKINADLTAQKTLSRKIVADSEQHALDDARRDQEITQEIEHHDQDARAKTAALQQQLASRSLQYGITPPVTGRGRSGPDGVPLATATPSAEGAATIQLPATLAGRLRLHAAEDDGYFDEYRKCFDYESQVAAWVKAHAGASNGH